MLCNIIFYHYYIFLANTLIDLGDEEMHSENKKVQKEGMSF